MKIFCAIVLFFPMIALADKKQDLEHLAVSTDPADLVARDVGTKGLPDFDPKGKYVIVVTPSLDSSTATGVKIPKDIREAVEELQVALPDWYRKELHFKAEQDQHNEPMVICGTDNWNLDLPVINWIKVYWNLKDVNSPLTSFFRKHVSVRYNADGVVSDVKDYLCNALHAERYKD